jgi:2-polyprenyl-3-methyl-5-hydroxy-6-metoxy-1,4-benzoquinol methylase
MYRIYRGISDDLKIRLLPLTLNGINEEITAIATPTHVVGQRFDIITTAKKTIFDVGHIRIVYRTEERLKLYFSMVQLRLYYIYLPKNMFEQVPLREKNVLASTTFKRIADTFDLPNKRVLDLGCSYGEFMASPPHLKK